MAGLRNLAGRTGCADVKTGAQQKIAALEATLAREAETCRREDQQVKGLAKAGNRAEIEAMRPTAQCPATVAAIDQAVRELAAAADAACARDNAALSAVGPRDADGLKRVIGRLSCDTVKASAQQRLADLEASLQHEADVCRRDGEAWKAAQAGRQADMEMLRGTIECPSVAAAMDQKMAALRQACARDKDALAKLAPRDLTGLRTFAGAASCDDVKADAQDRVAKLEATLAREAEICRTDTDKMQALSPGSLRGDVEALRRIATCPTVTAALDKRLADLQATCARDGEALAKLGDASGLRSFLTTTGCPDLKPDAQARLSSLEATAAQQAQICQRDSTRWSDLSASGDRRALEAARGDFKCPDVLASIDRKLATLRETCERDSAALGKLGTGDLTGVKDMAEHASCDEVKAAARLRVATAEAEAARQEEGCRREEVTFTAVQAKGADGRVDLVKLQQGMSCDRLRPTVKAALEQLTPAAPAINSTAQIHAAQADLRRIGCLAEGAGADGRLDPETEAAMRSYLQRTGHGLKPTTPVRVSDEVVASLGTQKERVCEPTVTARPTQEEPRRRKPEGVARRPVEERQPRERAARERPAREAAEPRQPARPIQGASSGGGGGGRAPAALGVGF
jgi:hypothetical protein